MNMKRTLCLVLSLLLLVGLIAPSAEAYSDDRTPIIISCPNWSKDIPVSQFRFEFRDPAYSLGYRPIFYYENERGEKVEETGKLRDIRYTLVLYIDCQNDPALEDGFEVWVNGVSAWGVKTYPWEYPWDVNSRDVVAHFDIYPHMTVSNPTITMNDLREDGPVFQSPQQISGLNMYFDVFDGPTPDSPLIAYTDETYNMKLEGGKSYLYRFRISPSNLNVELKQPFNISVAAPLVLCPEFTGPESEDHPDALTIYARYDCQKDYRVEMKTLEDVDGSIIIDNPYGDGLMGTNRHNFFPGETVHVRAYDGRGWKFHHWDVVGVELTKEQLYSREFDFIMPARDVTFTPAVVPQYHHISFADVSGDDWFYDEVISAVHYKMVNGVGNYEFNPYGICTRAQFVAMAVRGIDLSKYENDQPLPFADVPETAWYYDVVRTAYAAGLITGKTDTAFKPNDPVTRAEAAAILFRLRPGPVKDEFTCPFTDVAQDAFYYDAVRYANHHGFVTGVSATSFAPNVLCNRAQSTAMILRARRSGVPNK